MEALVKDSTGNDSEPQRVPRIALLLLFVLLLTATIIRVIHLDALGFWTDEQVDVISAERSFSELPYAIADMRFQAPLHFYVIALVNKIVGGSTFSLRLPEVVFGVLLILVVWAIMLRVANWRAGLWAVAYLTFSSYHIRYCQEVRFYGLLALMTALIIYTFIRAWERPTVVRWLLFGLSMGAGLLSQYLCVYAIVSCYVYAVGQFIFSRGWKDWAARRRQIVGPILSGLVGLILFFPWIVFCLQRTGAIATTGEVPIYHPEMGILDHLKITLGALAGPNGHNHWDTTVNPWSLVSLLLVVFGTCSLLRTGRGRAAIPLVIVLLGIAHIEWAHYIGRHSYVLRLVTFAIPSYAVFFAAGIETIMAAASGLFAQRKQITRPLVTAIGIALLVALNLNSLVTLYRNGDPIKWFNLRAIKHFLALNTSPDDIIVADIMGTEDRSAVPRLSLFMGEGRRIVVPQEVTQLSSSGATVWVAQCWLVEVSSTRSLPSYMADPPRKAIEIPFNLGRVLCFPKEPVADENQFLRSLEIVDDPDMAVRVISALWSLPDQGPRFARSALQETLHKIKLPCWKGDLLAGYALTCPWKSALQVSCPEQLKVKYRNEATDCFLRSYRLSGAVDTLVYLAVAANSADRPDLAIWAAKRALPQSAHLTEGARRSLRSTLQSAQIKREQMARWGKRSWQMKEIAETIVQDLGAKKAAVFIPYYVADGFNAAALEQHAYDQGVTLTTRSGSVKALLDFLFDSQYLVRKNGGVGDEAPRTFQNLGVFQAVLNSLPAGFFSSYFSRLREFPLRDGSTATLYRQNTVPLPLEEQIKVYQTAMEKHPELAQNASLLVQLADRLVKAGRADDFKSVMQKIPDTMAQTLASSETLPDLREFLLENCTQLCRQIGPSPDTGRLAEVFVHAYPDRKDFYWSNPSVKFVVIHRYDWLKDPVAIWGCKITSKDSDWLKADVAKQVYIFPRGHRRPFICDGSYAIQLELKMDTAASSPAGSLGIYLNTHSGLGRNGYDWGEFDALSIPAGTPGQATTYTVPLRSNVNNAKFIYEIRIDPEASTTPFTFEIGNMRLLKLESSLAGKEPPPEGFIPFQVTTQSLLTISTQRPVSSTSPLFLDLVPLRPLAEVSLTTGEHTLVLPRGWPEKDIAIHTVDGDSKKKAPFCKVWLEGDADDSKAHKTLIMALVKEGANPRATIAALTASLSKAMKEGNRLALIAEGRAVAEICLPVGSSPELRNLIEILVREFPKTAKADEASTVVAEGKSLLQVCQRMGLVSGLEPVAEAVIRALPDAIKKGNPANWIATGKSLMELCREIGYPVGVERVVETLTQGFPERKELCWLSRSVKSVVVHKYDWLKDPITIWGCKITSRDSDWLKADVRDHVYIFPHAGLRPFVSDGSYAIQFDLRILPQKPLPSTTLAVYLNTHSGLGPKGTDWGEFDALTVPAETTGGMKNYLLPLRSQVEKARFIYELRIDPLGANTSYTFELGNMRLLRLESSLAGQEPPPEGSIPFNVTSQNLVSISSRRPLSSTSPLLLDYSAISQLADLSLSRGEHILIWPKGWSQDDVTVRLVGREYAADEFENIYGGKYRAEGVDLFIQEAKFDIPTSLTAKTEYAISVEAENSHIRPVILALRAEDGKTELARYVFDRRDDSLAWQEKRITPTTDMKRISLVFVNDYSGPEGDLNARVTRVRIVRIGSVQ